MVISLTIVVGIALIVLGVSIGAAAFIYTGHTIAADRSSLPDEAITPVEALLQNRANKKKKKKATSSKKSTSATEKKSSKKSSKSPRSKPPDLLTDDLERGDDDKSSVYLEPYYSPGRSDVDDETDIYGEEHTTRTDRDLVLLETFQSVLKDGLVIKLHTKKKVRQITLHLDGEMLKWKFSGAQLNNRKYRLDLQNIHHAEMGKTTPVLEFADIADDLCFSLILADGSSVDFEASSRVERDALYQGFSMTLQDIREHEEFGTETDPDVALTHTEDDIVA